MSTDVELSASAERQSRDLRFRDGQEAAHQAQLNGMVSSQLASAGVRKLTQTIIERGLESGGRQHKAHGKSLAKLEQAVCAFVYELLKGASNDKARGWVGVALAAGAASGERVSYRHRKEIVRELKRLGWLEVDPGRQFVSADYFGGSKPDIRPGRTTRIRALPELLVFLAELGLSPDNFRQHFAAGLPKRTIYLRARKTKNGRWQNAGKLMAIEDTAEVRSLEAEVQQINEFLIGFTLEGGAFTGYKRRFNEGDAPDFNWNKGGRLYADFQQLPSEQRRSLKIDGEVVSELDVSASYLTILHGIHGVPFDTNIDPYRSDVLPRDVIKAFINQSLGSPQLATRWGNRWKELFREHHEKPLSSYQIAKVRDEVIALHPLLAKREKLKTTWADLMFVESEAMIAATKALMAHGAPSFVVHDSLIVRAKDRKLAEGVIKEAYKQKCGLVPRVRSKSTADVDAKRLQDEG